MKEAKQYTHDIEKKKKKNDETVLFFYCSIAVLICPIAVHALLYSTEN